MSLEGRVGEAGRDLHCGQPSGAEQPGLLMTLGLELADICKEKMMRLLRGRKYRWGLILTIFGLCIGGLFSLAYAQSGASSFNLNSPASFPVDI